MIGSTLRVETKEFRTEKSYIERMRQWLYTWANSLLLEKGWLYAFAGFLLGRAIILTEVSPFATAFIAVMWFLHRDKIGKSIIAAVAGALTISIEHGIFIGISIIVVMLLAGLFKKVKNQQAVIPFLVFAASITPRIFLYSIQGQLTYYEWMLMSIEAFLGMILVLIFMQSIPLLSPKRYNPSLKNEEIVCMIILIASVLTGMIGWGIYGVGIEQVFSRYFVLVFGFVGGAAIGSTVGVVAGLILSLANVANLYQMSLLAFSGLLGGLLKEGRKIGVGAGLFVGTFLIGIYGNAETLGTSLIETSVAVVLFFLTPTSWFSQIAKYIPGTEEYKDEQEKYSQKVRNVTAERVGKFSEVFGALSKSFENDETIQLNEEEEQRETDYFLSQVTERSCQTCFMKERCWEKSFDTTYHYMEQLKDAVTAEEIDPKLMRQFENHCVKSRKVIDIMKDEITFFEANRKLRKQVIESKRLVANQLQGVSEVMDDFAKEILKERQLYEKQEMEIVHALKKMGVELEKLNIYQLEKGNVDIEMTVIFGQYHGEGEKIIAPVLSDILSEMIIVKEEEISPFPGGYSYLSFGSAKEYVVETGAAGAAKGGGLISGDSYTTIELGEGKFGMAISDGMGNGERAREESTETLRLLQRILQTGIPEKVAIKSINSILSLRTTDEMFATLDLALIDLNNASVQFLKIGSAPSYIKSGDEVKKIEAGNLPIGIISEFDVDIVNEQLRSGDFLIMVSDGILDDSDYIQNTDLWIKRKLNEIETEDPQEIADLLLEEVIRSRGGEIHDDMTVLVTKVEKNLPEWASIPVYESEAK